MSLRGTPQLCVVSVSSCLACSASLPASPSSVELDTTPGSERKRREERGRERGREGEREGGRDERLEDGEERSQGRGKEVCHPVGKKKTALLSASQ